MFSFAWPWIFLALPFPWLVYRFIPAAETTEAALPVPFYHALQPLTVNPESASEIWKKGVMILIWMLVVIGCARPQWIGESDQIPVTGRDMMLAVDVSGSMKADDMEIGGQRVNRLIAAKAVAQEFIDARKGDRIGLILFGTRAYLQSPLSFDLETVNTLLQESEIGIAGEKTAIGDAVGLAIKRLTTNSSDSDLSRKVLILMTDGANTAGIIDPVEAAAMAARVKLKIYTIGLGAETMVVNSILGQRVVNPSAELDEDTLTEMARLTNGRYFRAKDTAALMEIYSQIDRLEPIEEDARYLRPVDEWYFWFLGAAGILFLCTLLAILNPLQGIFHDPASTSSEVRG